MALLKRLSSSSLDSCVRDPQAECYERFARRRSWRDADARTNKRRRKMEGKKEERGSRSAQAVQSGSKTQKPINSYIFFLQLVPIFIWIPLRFPKAQNTFHEMYVVGKDSNNRMGWENPAVVVFYHIEKKLLPPLSSSFLFFRAVDEALG